jgi:hypothetical protein
MSKSPKHNGSERAKGRIVALEGVCGPDLSKAAMRMVKAIDHHDLRPALSRWDSSNTFFELRMAKSKQAGLPPRTLLLLYASDLLFRLRWEIRPALEEGRVVIAAPYVQTAIGFGLAAGLPRDWLQELFRFAPIPAASLRNKEKKPDQKKAPRPKDGFVEFGCATLVKLSPEWSPALLSGGIFEHLVTLEEEDGISRFGKKLPKQLLKTWREA